MTDKHEGCIRGFYRSSKAWHHRVGNLPEVMFGMYGEDGDGTTGEMSMTWHDLGRGQLTPRLEIFCDAWDAMQRFRDVFAKLAEHDDEDITEAEFAEILAGCGLVDITKYESPYK